MAVQSTGKRERELRREWGWGGGRERMCVLEGKMEARAGDARGDWSEMGLVGGGGGVGDAKTHT